MILKVAKSLLMRNYRLNTYKIIYAKHLFSSSKRVFYFSEDDGNKNHRVTKQDFYRKKQEELLKSQIGDDPTTYDKSTTKAGKIFTIFGVVMLIGCVVYLEYNYNQEIIPIDQNISGMYQASIKGNKNIGGEWTLINSNGQPFSTDDLRGSYYLIYFGFTKCPDICPAVLYKLSRIIKHIRQMPESKLIDLKVVFVSVDPDRDKPAKMKQYLKNFDKSIIGVSGVSNDDPELKNCLKSFKIYSNRIYLNTEDQQTKFKYNGQNNYLLDHTIITYLMSDNNQFINFLNPNQSENKTAISIVRDILGYQHGKIRKNQRIDQLKRSK